MPLKGLAGVLLLVLLAAGVTGVLQREANTRPAATARVTHVYDGDTIEAAGVGKVRLQGIDAMDGFDRDHMRAQALRYGIRTEQVKHWAGRATEFARERLLGDRVKLRFGPEPKDRYGRTLAYVHLQDGSGEQDFNRLMLRRGLAVAYRRFHHPRLSQYLGAEQKAQEENVGIWQDAEVR
ncbi:MAG: thermonuclease family protein [Planctomycetota bacterium]